MNPRARIEFRTRALRDAGLWRDPIDGLAGPEGGAEWVDTRSNDYLGLAASGVSRETGEPERWGAGASRVVSGTWPEHTELERSLASWLRTEACLLFSSGYAANIGVISALAGPGETILSDALNHASIIDGCRLSRATVVVLPHAQPEALERALADTAGVRWVVTESYFGMDGDTPNLVRMRALCDAHGAALVVDEAHALGLFGPEGRGLCADTGVVPDVLIGGLGKAFGSQGGFAACDRLFRDWLWNRARSLVFSTAPSPRICRETLGALDRVRRADPERQRVRAIERELEATLRAAGVPLPPHRHGPIFPIVFGSEAAVLGAAAHLRGRGIRCQPIRPPTVPRGSSRLRVTVRADLSDVTVAALGAGLVAVWQHAQAKLLEPAAPKTSPAPAVPHGAERSSESDLAADRDMSTLPTRSAASTSSATSSGDDAWPHPPSNSQRPSSPPITSDRRVRSDPHEPPNAPASAPTTSGPEDAEALRRRWVVLGTGTGIGKTYVARMLVGLLSRRECPVAGLKPIETGVPTGGTSNGDAMELAHASFHVKLPPQHPLYALPEPLTPALSARRAGTTIDLNRIPKWVQSAAGLDGRPPALVIETAGGAFSPINDAATNFDLALLLEPAIWLLVAPDRLGVLHDIQSALQAMRSLGRSPDWIILSEPKTPDQSTGTNAAELRRRPCPPIITLPRNDTRALAPLLLE